MSTQSEPLFAWMWQDFRGRTTNPKWYLFDSFSAASLEDAFMKGHPIVTLNHGFYGKQGGYEVDLKAMTQKKLKTGFSRSIARKKLTKKEFDDMVVWEWLNDNNHWIEFGPEVDSELEKAYHTDKLQVQLAIFKKNYQINFCSFEQVNLVTRRRRSIRRVPEVPNKMLCTPEPLEGMIQWKKPAAFLGLFASDVKMYAYERGTKLELCSSWDGKPEESIPLNQISTIQQGHDKTFTLTTPEKKYELSCINKLGPESNPHYWIHGIQQWQFRRSRRSTRTPTNLNNNNNNVNANTKDVPEPLKKAPPPNDNYPPTPSLPSVSSNTSNNDFAPPTVDYSPPSGGCTGGNNPSSTNLAIAQSDTDNKTTTEEPATTSSQIGDEEFATENREKGHISQYYSISKQLGKGSFGSVFLVTEKQTQGQFAAKQISKLMVPPNELTLMYREAAVMKQLNHGNIVKLFEIFETDEELFLVMELVAGGELMDVILNRVNGGQFFSEEEAQAMIGQTLEGLAYCHSRRIAHRDIKPQNLLASSAQWPFDVKITDWGFAKQISDNTDFSTMLGTPLFMAPEILVHRNYDGFKVDIWALGIIFYIIFCGYPPFKSSGDLNLLLLGKLLPLEFPDPAWSLVSLPAKNLISRMLEKDSERRLTAQECLAHPFFTLNTHTVLTGFNTKAFASINFKEKN